MVAVVALASSVVAWFLGWQRNDTDLAPFLRESFPCADRFQPCGAGVYAAFGDADDERLAVGYVAVGEANGYGGPLQLAVGVDLAGTILGLAVIDHNETAAYFQRVLAGDVLNQLVGKVYSDPFRNGDDVDAVTGATMTSVAIAESARLAARNVAGDQLQFPLPAEEPVPFEFGLPEVVLLSLYVVAFVSYSGRLKSRRIVRWASLLSGLIVLGFWVNAPLTLTNINSLLLGYWPRWQSHLYWYLLIVGVLLLPVVTGRNPYCHCICPFGAAQQCLGVVGGAKPRISPRWRRVLHWVPRFLAWGAILLALTYRNPALANYEVYGALFTVIGTHFQFGLLAVFLIASLFIRRPWCNYACPVRAVTDYMRLVRRGRFWFVRSK
jgi:uncharacterized protein with FMN-binding domain